MSVVLLILTFWIEKFSVVITRSSLLPTLSLIKTDLLNATRWLLDRYLRVSLHLAFRVLLDPHWIFSQQFTMIVI